MTPRKLKVRICQYPYAGNGATAATHPNIGNWLARTALHCAGDSRIESLDIDKGVYVDTPIPMLRNRSVVDARRDGIDCLVMVDSDQQVDYLLGIDPDAVPFFESSFDYLYKHYDKGPVAIFSPYCGPPPDEMPYMFRWSNMESNSATDRDMQLRMFTRHEVMGMSGIQDVAATPTGLCMFDVRVFELTDPQIEYEHLVNDLGMDPEEAKQQVCSWFYYEWTDIYHSDKASTEDVTFSRDLSLIGIQKLGYNPVKGHFSAWAGHWKPKMVGKPQMLRNEDVSRKFRAAVTANVSRNERMIQADLPLPGEMTFTQIMGNRNVTITEPIHAGNGAHH